MSSLWTPPASSAPKRGEDLVVSTEDGVPDPVTSELHGPVAPSEFFIPYVLKFKHFFVFIIFH